MANELGLLLSISLSGYGMAFAIISLIVAIPYLLLRRGVAPQAPTKVAKPSSVAPEEIELAAVAAAAAMHVHASLRRRVPTARARGYAPVSGWVVASRIDQMASFERGWGERGWQIHRS